MAAIPRRQLRVGASAAIACLKRTYGMDFDTRSTPQLAENPSRA